MKTYKINKYNNKIKNCLDLNKLLLYKRKLYFYQFGGSNELEMIDMENLPLIEIVPGRKC